MAHSHVEGEFDRLKKQFHLLSGDKRAFYENTQAEIAKNRDMISLYRTENEQLRQKVSTLNRDSTRPQGKYCYAKLIVDPAGNSKSDLCQIAQPLFLGSEYETHERRVHHQREKLDEVKVVTKKKEEYLAKLKMDVKLKPKPDKHNRQSKKSRDLENRLDKALLKYKEAQAIRKTYLKISDCLQKDRLTYDNRLAQLEKALKYKKSQYEELEVMARDAIHAKVIAKDEQHKFEEYFTERKKAHEKELANLKEMVKAAMEENVYLEEKKLSSKVAVESESAADSEAAQSQEQMQLRFFEMAFKKIKNVTGVAHINEVIGKFQQQADTQTHLLQMTEESKHRREHKQKEKQDRMDDLNQFKFAEDTQSSSKKVTEDLEQKLATVVQEKEQKEERMMRTEQLLTKAIVGIQHLTSKVTSKNAFDLASESIEGMKARMGELEEQGKLSAEESQELKRIKEVVKAGAAALMKMEQMPDLERVLNEEACVKSLTVLEEKLIRFSTKTEQMMSEGDISPEDVILQVPRFNVRIDLSAKNDNEEEETFQTGDEDIMTREQIKKMSAFMVDSKTKKKGGKKSGRGRK